MYDRNSSLRVGLVRLDFPIWMTVIRILHRVSDWVYNFCLNTGTEIQFHPKLGKIASSLRTRWRWTVDCQKVFAGTQNFTFLNLYFLDSGKHFGVEQSTLESLLRTMAYACIYEHAKINIFARKLCTEYCFTLKSKTFRKFNENITVLPSFSKILWAYTASQKIYCYYKHLAWFIVFLDSVSAKICFVERWSCQ